MRRILDDAERQASEGVAACAILVDQLQGLASELLGEWDSLTIDADVGAP